MNNQDFHTISSVEIQQKIPAGLPSRHILYSLLVGILSDVNLTREEKRVALHQAVESILTISKQLR